MAIIAEEFEFVVGVDTHARTHTYTAVHASTCAVVDTAAFPATSPGMDRAIAWIRRRTGGKSVFAAAEGTSSYGARLTQALLAADIEVGEVRPPTRPSRALTGKSDPIDAEAAARSVLGRPRSQVMEPRAGGTRAAIRILLASRSLLDHQRTANPQRPHGPAPRHRSRNRRPGIPAGHTDHRHRSLADLKQHRPRDPNRPRRGQTPGLGRQRPHRPARRKPQGIGPAHRRIGTGASIRPGGRARDSGDHHLRLLPPRPHPLRGGLRRTRRCRPAACLLRQRPGTDSTAPETANSTERSTSSSARA